MPSQLALDPAIEAQVERRLTEHFTRLGYFQVAQAVGWSLSLGGALVRFHPLLPFLADKLGRLRLLVSGMGSGSEMIAARNFGFGEVHGTEVDAFYVSLVAERLAAHPGFFPMVVDGERVPYADGSFDVVVSGHIVEHTADPAGYVAEHLRVLRPGGFLLLEFPTRFHTRELHTGMISLEWLPDRLRTAVLRHIGDGRGPIRFSETTRKKARAITDTALKQVSLRRVRRWVAKSGTPAALVAKGRPGPGVVYGIFQKSW